MSVKPILFNTDMVRAILDGRKTVTRRIVNKIPLNAHRIEFDGNTWSVMWGEFSQGALMDFEKEIKALFQPGDILYVRETWRYGNGRGSSTYQYLADWTKEELKDEPLLKWHPSIHMPKEAARIWLKVTNVRVERLQDITAEQARKEGVKDPYDYQEPSFYERESMKGLECDIAAFAGLWFSTLPRYYYDWQAWGGNPWVWAIEFERCEKPQNN